MRAAARSARWLAFAAGIPLLVGCSVFSTPSHGKALGLHKHTGKLDSLVYVNPLPGDPLWDRLGSCLTKLGRPRGIKVKIIGPPGGDVDTTAMQDEISQAIATHADAIVTWSGLSRAGFDALFARARRNNMVVSTILSSGYTQNQNLSIDRTPTEGGTQDAMAVVDRKGPQRVAVIVQETTGPGYGAYQAAFRAVVAAHPNTKVVAFEGNHGQFSQDAALASRIIANHPDVNLIVNYSGFPGVPSTIEQDDLAGKVALYQSADFPNNAIDLFDKGILTKVRAVNPCEWAADSIDNFEKAWAGKAIPDQITPVTRFVDEAEFRRLVAMGWV